MPHCIVLSVHGNLPRVVLYKQTIRRFTSDGSIYHTLKI